MNAPIPPYRPTNGPICGATLLLNKGKAVHTCALANGHRGPHCCNSANREGCRLEWEG